MSIRPVTSFPGARIALGLFNSEVRLFLGALMEEMGGGGGMAIGLPFRVATLLSGGGGGVTDLVCALATEGMLTAKSTTAKRGVNFMAGEQPLD
jgi:hypothetical protein